MQPDTLCSASPCNLKKRPQTGASAEASGLTTPTKKRPKDFRWNKVISGKSNPFHTALKLMGLSTTHPVQRLQHGSHGIVYKVQDKSNHNYALKMISSRRTGQKDDFLGLEKEKS